MSARLRRAFGRTFGVRGAGNLTSWFVAGGIAYYYIYLPDRKRAQETLVRAGAAALGTWLGLFTEEHCDALTHWPPRIAQQRNQARIMIHSAIYCTHTHTHACTCAGGTRGSQAACN